MKSQQQPFEQRLRTALAAAALEDFPPTAPARAYPRRAPLESSGDPALDKSDRLRELVSDVAAAYFSNSHVSPSEIPTVVAQIASSLSAVVLTEGAPVTVASAPAIDRPSAAQIKASVKYDGLLSFEDGRVYKSLRRHLANRGLTPETYREKWGLPNDYPMVAASLSAKRSNMARANGLGRKRD